MMDEFTRDDAERIGKVVYSKATPAQKKVFKTFQEGDVYLFALSMRNVPIINSKSIELHLEVMTNTVEGDTSQLPSGLVKYAKKKGWLKGFDTWKGFPE
jgi:hypothetical protein